MGFLQTFQHLLPRARAWRITVDKTLRQFFEGLSEQPAAIRTWLDLIWWDIFPDTTREIAEFEAQFGLVPNVGDSDETRTDRIAAAWAAQGGQDPSYIQTILQAAGFTDLYVHDFWSSALPYVPLDPRDYTEQPLIGTTQCSALASQPQCSAKGSGSDGLPLVQWQCNDFLANEIHYLVNHNLTRRAPPRVPDDPRKWPLFVYIGPEVLDTATLVYIPNEQRQELERLALKLCPTEKWIVLRTMYEQLQDLGTMVGLYRADWAGNTIDTGEMVNWENIITPGTGDLYRHDPAHLAAYSATGWGGVAPGVLLTTDTEQYYETTDYGAEYNGTTDCTLIAVVHNVDDQGTAGFVFGVCESSATQQHAIKANNWDWELRRRGNGTFGIDTKCDDMGGRAVVIVTLSAGLLNAWVNGVHTVTDVDVSAEVPNNFSRVRIGYPQGGDTIWISLAGIYSTALTEAQAATAYALIVADFPVA